MNQSTQLIHEKNLRLAKTILLSEGELLASLMEMQTKRLFSELECKGIFSYCLKHLNFSESQAFYYQKIAQASRSVPELKEAVVKGELSISKARRITKVITPQNQKLWIENAKHMKQKELERAVSHAFPGLALPEKIKPIAQNVSELRVSIDDETDENLEIPKDLLSQKLNRAATLSDVIAWAAKETRERFDPEKKAIRAKKKLSSTQSKSTLHPKSGRKPMLAAVKHEVVRKKGFQCTHIGKDGTRCEERRWLHAHHLIPVARGGQNTVENLELLCSHHHRLRHRAISSGA